MHVNRSPRRIAYGPATKLSEASCTGGPKRIILKLELTP